MTEVDGCHYTRGSDIGINSGKPRPTRFVSVMVPLSTGQSKSVVIQVTPHSDALCDGCKRRGSVVMPTGERCVVAECPDCALDGMFLNGYGHIIDGEISLDELIRDEAKYVLSPSSWLDAYTSGELTRSLLLREHDEADVLFAMERLVDDASPQADTEEMTSPGLSSLKITSPKVTGRARRKIDVARLMMERLVLDEHLETDLADDGRTAKRQKRSLRGDAISR